MPSAGRDSLLEQIPSTDETLRSSEIQALVSRDGRKAVTTAVRKILERIRFEISRGLLDTHSAPLALAGIPEAVDRELRAALGYSLRPVVNATGVILHTNLGRALLSESALDH